MTAADVLLSDGAVAVIRPVEPGDGAALHELHERVSDESLRLRFFSSGRRPGHAYVDHALGAPDVIALVACVGDRIAAFATAEPVGSRTSEVGFLVADDIHGHGLGTLLLEHLAAVARDEGIDRFTALVLAENHPMLAVFTDVGFDINTVGGGQEYEVTLDIAATAALQAAADAREFEAEARSLRPLLAPPLGCALRRTP